MKIIDLTNDDFNLIYDIIVKYNTFLEKKKNRNFFYEQVIDNNNRFKLLMSPRIFRVVDVLNTNNIFLEIEISNNNNNELPSFIRETSLFMNPNIEIILIDSYKFEYKISEEEYFQISTLHDFNYTYNEIKIILNNFEFFHKKITNCFSVHIPELKFNIDFNYTYNFLLKQVLNELIL